MDFDAERSSVGGPSSGLSAKAGHELTLAMNLNTVPFVYVDGTKTHKLFYALYHNAIMETQDSGSYTGIIN